MSAKKATDTDIVNAIVKTRGRVKNAAAMLGMNHSTVSHRLKKPAIQKTLAQLNQEALAKSGASLAKIYKRAAEGLDATRVISCNVHIKDNDTAQDIGEMKEASEASKDFIDVPDFKERRESVKICLQLTGRLEDAGKDKESLSTIVVNMPVVVIDGNPLKFKVGNNDYA